MDHTGKIIPESDLRKLWVIRRSVGIRDEWYPDGRAYLTRDGRWGPLDVAAAWHENEKELAQDVAAAVILTDPCRYVGEVDVVEILG